MGTQLTVNRLTCYFNNMFIEKCCLEILKKDCYKRFHSQALLNTRDSPAGVIEGFRLWEASGGVSKKRRRQTCSVGSSLMPPWCCCDCSSRWRQLFSFSSRCSLPYQTYLFIIDRLLDEMRQDFFQRHAFGALQGTSYKS